jgi:hypothetical protein
MSSTQTKQSRTLTFIYPVVATACIAHAIAFGVSPWLSIWDIPHGPHIWFAILGTWPLWVFPLLWCRAGRKSRVIVPLVAGVVALLPGFLVWYVMANFSPV